MPLGGNQRERAHLQNSLSVVSQPHFLLSPARPSGKGKDQAGVLWLGTTENGAYRFDRKGFVIFRP